MAGATNFREFNPGTVNQESDSSYDADSLRVNGAPSGGICPSPTFNKLEYANTTFIASLAKALANKNYTVRDGSTSPVDVVSFSPAVLNLAAVLANLLTFNDVPTIHTDPAFTASVPTLGPTGPTPPPGSNNTQLATTAFVNQILAGVASGFQASLTTPNGYIKFPNILGGIIVQWMSGPNNPPGGAGEVTFSVAWPLVFPHACLKVLTTLNYDSGGDTDADYQVVGAPSTTGATIFLNEFSNGRGTTTRAFIFAIGY